MGRRGPRSVLGVIEQAYAAADDDATWMRGMLEALAPAIGDGCGVCAYTFDATRVPPTIGAFVDVGLTFPREIVLASVAGVDEAYVAQTWRRLRFAYASRVARFADLPAAAPFVGVGVHDVFVINAYDTSGGGVWLGAPRSREGSATPAERRLWPRVAAHIASAYRLRRRARRREAAVLSPGGRVEHAEGDAKLRSARAALVAAVSRMERARGPLRATDPDAAVETRKGLVDGNCSLVERFERDGRRFIVAVENEPAAPGPEALSCRERQVLAGAAAGRTNKLIAYEMGLSDSTVRVLLSRAARKLRVTSRSELVALFLAHDRAANTHVSE